MIKFQNYKHYKLPITINPLEYGKLIYHNDNIYIVQFNRTNVVLINKNDLENHVKFYKEGVLIYEYKDLKLSNNSFIRSLQNNIFTFKDNKLILVNTQKSIVYRFNINQLNRTTILYINIYKWKI